MTPEILGEFKKQLEAVAGFKKESLVQRDRWGELTFEKAGDDINRIFQVVGYLSILPVEHLPTQVMNQTQDALRNIVQLFKQVDAFSISVSNAVGVRDSHVQSIRQMTDALYASIAPWIPFLAYQKGDVAGNIEKLTVSVRQANALVDDAKGQIQQKQQEISDIITKAREASAAAGAAVFTQDFVAEAARAKDSANGWLKMTGGMGLLTVVSAWILWALVERGLDSGQIWQKVSTKVIVLGVMVTATVWCGRIYKALMHQATVNKHRAMSIQTVQAFAAAVADPAVKDAIVHEAAKSIFSSEVTGYIDGGGGDHEGDVKIFEVVKGCLPPSPSKS